MIDPLYSIDPLIDPLKPIENPLLISFSLKQCVPTHSTYGTTHLIKGDEIDFSSNIRHFSNRMNQRVFGNSFRRFGKRLKMLFVIEGGTNGVRSHYHTVIQTPPQFVGPFSLEKTEHLVFDIWRNKTLWGYQKNDVQQPKKEKGDVEGWIDYISKERTKRFDLNSSVDWLNTYLE